tara:strand:- start:253 stop:495 length:243 start_codon:yes stop_codon:yes gene_type:complete
MSNSSNENKAQKPNKRLSAGLMVMYFGLGINLFGFASIGDLFEGLGLLIMALGIGIITADYVYPNTGEDIIKAVENFEES